VARTQARYLRIVAFDHIIVGVDASDYGFEALQQALALRPADGTLSAVTVLEDHLAAQTGFDARRVAADMADEAERTRQRAEGLLEGQAFCEARVVRGRSLQILTELCLSEQAALVAVGGRHHSRPAGILLGSIATSLLHDAPCSVLLARPRWGELWKPQRILVGVDGSEQSLVALAAADELAERLGSAVTVLAATGGKPIESDRDWAGRVGTWASGSPVGALLDQSIHADLVILGSRGLHGLSALGSVSERVAHRAPCSVLVMRPASHLSAGSPDLGGVV
jgi:nucleotide-binding universal stress UspA family protein